MPARTLGRLEIWAVLMARGGLLIILGLIALLFPFASLISLSFLVAILAIVEGMIWLFFAGERSSTMSDLALGVTALIVGITVFVAPFIATAALSLATLLALAFWCIFSGIRALADKRATIHPLIGRKVTRLWGAMMLLIGMTIPVLLLVVPGSLSLAAWIFAIAALFIGGSLMWQGLTLRHAAKQSDERPIAGVEPRRQT